MNFQANQMNREKITKIGIGAMLTLTGVLFLFQKDVFLSGFLKYLPYYLLVTGISLTIVGIVEKPKQKTDDDENGQPVEKNPYTEVLKRRGNRQPLGAIGKFGLFLCVLPAIVYSVLVASFVINLVGMFPIQIDKIEPFYSLFNFTFDNGVLIIISLLVFEGVGIACLIVDKLKNR